MNYSMDRLTASVTTCTYATTNDQWASPLVSSKTKISVRFSYVTLYAPLHSLLVSRLLARHGDVYRRMINSFLLSNHCPTFNRELKCHRMQHHSLATNWKTVDCRTLCHQS